MSRLDPLLKLHQADPADADLPYMIAMEHAKLGQIDEALEWLDRTLAIKPTYCYAYFQKGRLLHERGGPGDATAARAAVETGLARATECGDAHARDELATLLTSLEG